MNSKLVFSLSIFPMLAIALAGCVGRDTTGRSTLIPFFGSKQSDDQMADAQYADTSRSMEQKDAFGAHAKGDTSPRAMTREPSALASGQPAKERDPNARIASSAQGGDGAAPTQSESQNFAPIVQSAGQVPGSVAQASGQTRLVSSQRRTPVLMTLGKRDSLDLVVQNAPGIVLIDFYADWCGPCKTQGRILHEMEDTAAENNATIVKVNVEHHKELASKYNVKALPTLVVLKNGNLVTRQKGLADRRKIASYLSSR